MFQKEMLNNKALTESALNFTKWRDLRLNQTRKVKMGPPDPMTGYPVPMDEFDDDGNLTLRYYAPEAKEMYAVTGSYQEMKRIDMTKREDGVFEGILEYDPEYTGLRKLTFYLDGTPVINAKMPVLAGNQSFTNVIEIPNPDIPQILINDVPHGSLSKEIYYSHALGEWMRCMVYLPPSYHEGGKYPVLYLQDGALGSELTWMYGVKVPYMMDNLIEEGKIEPFIVVTNDPMMQLPYELEAVDNFEGFEKTIINDCIPFIDSRFRTKADKWHRGFAGFSLGSMETTYMGVRHPELFGWLGILSGYIRRRDSHPAYEQNPYLFNLTQDFVEENYALFFRCMGDRDGNFPEFLEDDEFLNGLGGDKASSYIRKVYPGHIHDINTERLEYTDFAEMLFRQI